MEGSAYQLGLAAGLFIGVIVGAIVMVVATWFYTRYYLPKQVAGRKHLPGAKNVVASLAVLSVVVHMLYQSVVVAYAQTATIVPLEIPINPVFEQTNNWMATFAPIVAIGIGITLALAIFGFIARMIKSAF